MKEFIAELLFHFFIMMIIPLVNIILSRQSRNNKINFTFFLTICLSLLISSLFPVRITDGLEFDLKFIPIFIAFYYIGPRWGLMAIGILLGITLFVDITKLIPNIINYFFMTILFFIVYKHYIRKRLLFKLLAGVIFYLFIFTTRTIYLMQTGAMGDFPHLVWFSIVSIITLSTTIYLIEMNKLQLLMMEQLKKADKLNAISQLAASIAHEIRNPMTTIRGFLQLMKNEKNITASQGMFISLSLEELDRTNQIINDFLSLARPISEFTETIPLSNIMLDISDFMKPYAVMSNVKMNIHLEDNLYIAGNVNECKQLFINLIKNGIEAMPDGGNLEINGYQRNDMAIIEIKDNGVGFSAIQLNQLGQPYYSTKTKGTGLGLMISFDIIKRLKGDYNIESIENKGTIFTITFPVKM
ncbi:ATP-binding protein [Bacillus sp. DTU_2020_1000418_1_SI_GHA_SEK_038]|uniref:ATP-binding protein n=1 Tax=Bacillus sp. DTU_2020_1000418_1_SI_GHA_SEK_038 TaxID=3077585 RepID=UPI0028ED96F9|nr:ATP-binding protein [Bacillus sp. DTU_2020_1000418_1_SI_GHA_SEK_038]WNS73542.1 ATP-binding protein [Bacillus sp. DTU_2020_1000418_1_SI_GHA_SEK_038]